jgi:hypothetical protein
MRDKERSLMYIEGGVKGTVTIIVAAATMIVTAIARTTQLIFLLKSFLQRFQAEYRQEVHSSFQLQALLTIRETL